MLQTRVAPVRVLISIIVMKLNCELHNHIKTCSSATDTSVTSLIRSEYNRGLTLKGEVGLIVNPTPLEMLYPVM